MNLSPVCGFFGRSLPLWHGARAGVTRAFSYLLIYGFLAGVVAFILVGAGCVRNETSPEWQLGKEGEAMYYFLVQLEAAASGDTQTFTSAGEKLLELQPDEVSYLEMAEFAMRRGNVEEARITARKGLVLFPSSLPLTLIISDTYLQQEKNREASEALLFFLKGSPDNKEAVQELARVYLVGERYTEFDALLKTVPSSGMTPYLRYVKARSLLNRNRLTEGMKELRLVVKEAPDMIDAWVNLGITLQAKGRFTDSFPMFKKAVDLDPENLGLWLRLLDAQLRGKRVDLAQKTLREAPDSLPFRMEAAMLFIEMKQYTVAHNLLVQIKNMPGAPDEVHIYLAALAMENFRNPSEALRELAAIDPKSPLADRALRWRLQILEETGRTAECVPIAREFAEQNPNSSEFQVIYALAAGMAGETETSINVLREAHKKWPDNVPVAVHLASTLELVKERKEALELMEFVIQSDPKNATALNYVGYTLAEEGRELERARGLIERAVAESPEDPHIADSMAWVLYQLGNYNGAWENIRKSVNLGGDHAVIWSHYGDIAMKIGNNAEARKGYTNALNLKPDNPEEIQTKLRELP